MKQVTQPFLLACAVILMAYMLIAMLPFAKVRPQLTICYLAQTNDVDRSIAFFTISNAGNVSVSNYRSGNLEMRGQDHGLQVGCEPKQSQLKPGESVVDTVYLPKSIEKPWRLTVCYSSDVAIRIPRMYYVTSEWIQ